MTERLDRLEALAETILLAIQQQQATQNADRQEFRGSLEAGRQELRACIDDVVGMIGTLAETATETFARIDLMQSEIRGLQTENRRILERMEQRDS